MSTLKRRYPSHRDPSLLRYLQWLPQIPEEILNNLDPQYSIVLNNLLTSFSDTKNKTQLKDLFDSFADKYLVLPQLWIYRSRLDHPKNVIDRCSSQFYEIYFADNDKNLHAFDKCGPILWIESSDYSKLDIINLFGYQDKAKYLLDYPHERLEKIFDFYEAYGDKILTQKEYLKYKTTLKHQEKISAATTVENCFQCLVKIEDERTAIQNIEILIAKNPCNKWLWQSYMEYIKDRHPKAYLDILQKYIRFFISETSMKELFKKEKERIESMPEFSAMKSLSHFLLKKPQQNYTTKITQKMIKNASKNFIRQNFFLPMPIIRYMLTNGTVRQKNILYETCKQLFLLQPFPICCNITFTEKRSNKNCFIGQSLRLFRSPPPKIGNLFLTKTLTIDAPKSSTVLSKLICKIAKCEIWSLDVVGQIISWKNLHFLLEAETIKHFSFIEGKIIANDENLISIEDVIEALPFADKIYLNSAAFTQNTFAKLATLNRKEKFKYFEIGNVDSSFNFNDFENFVKEHFQPKAEIILRVKQKTSLQLIRNLNQIMLESWTSKETKPKITVL